MFEDKKRIIFIGGAIFLAIVLIIVLIFFRKKVDTTNVPSDGTTATTTLDKKLEAQIKQLPPATPAKIQEEEKYSFGLKQVAISFSERFGSYSNHAGIETLEGLFPLATPKMQGYIGKVIASNKNSTSTFESFGSKALSSSLSNVTDQNATVVVKTQRSHTIGDGAPTVYYQDIMLKFLKVGQEWKVDEARWQ